MANGKKQLKGTEKYQDDTIDLARLGRALVRRFWAILLSALICGGIACSYAAIFVVPLYQASALMYVNNSESSIDSSTIIYSTGQLSAAQRLIDTYAVILKSRTTLEEVIEEAGLSCSYSELYSMISVESVNDTEIFSITVTDTDPEEAALIANTIADILPDRISEIVEGSSVKIADSAVVPTAKVSPDLMDYARTGALIGFLISFAAVMVLEVFDDAIHDGAYLLQTYDIPILAEIPDLMENEGNGYYGYGSAVGSAKNKGMKDG